MEGVLSLLVGGDSDFVSWREYIVSLLVGDSEFASWRGLCVCMLGIVSLLVGGGIEFACWGWSVCKLEGY